MGFSLGGSFILSYNLISCGCLQHSFNERNLLQEYVGGGGEDYGDTKCVIRPGDVYLNFQTKKDSVYVGNYIVYLSKHDKVTDENADELKAQIVWFYSI